MRREIALRQNEISLEAQSADNAFAETTMVVEAKCYLPPVVAAGVELECAAAARTCIKARVDVGRLKALVAELAYKCSQ